MTGVSASTRILCWLDVDTTAAEQDQATPKQVIQLHSKYKQLSILLTAGAGPPGPNPPTQEETKAVVAFVDQFAAACGVQDQSMLFDNAAVAIKPQSAPKDVVASQLHLEVRLRMPAAASDAAASRSPLGGIEVGALVKALRSALPGEPPVEAIYDDSDESGGSALVRICISDVTTSSMAMLTITALDNCF